MARGVDRPKARASGKMSANFSAISPAARPSTRTGCAITVPKSSRAPTVTKNRPSSSPLNGSIITSISRRYSVSASSTPATNAPSAIDMPVMVATCPASRMTSRQAAMNSSRLRDSATVLNSGRSSQRPPRISTPMPISAGISASSPCAPTPCPPGLSGEPVRIIAVTMIGATATSCASSTANTLRPEAEFSALRSASTGMITAVEDRASAMPKRVDPTTLRPMTKNTTASAIEDSTICEAPSPSTMRRIALRRSKVSSSPMENSRNTTPSSASRCTAWVRIIENASSPGRWWLSRPSASGPISTPTSRKPSTLDTLKRCASGTMIAEASRNTMMKT